MELTLSARPPFALSSVVNSHGWVQLLPFARGSLADGFTRVERLASGRVVELIVRGAPDGVNVEVGGRLSKAERDEIARKVDWMLMLDRDLAAFYAAVRDEPKLAQVAERARGRLLRSPTLFEDVVKTILTTNTAWSGTIRMVEALVSRFGDPLPADPAGRAFPTPDQLAAADVETLRATAKLGYRAPYVLELARSVVSLPAPACAGLPAATYSAQAGAHADRQAGGALDLEALKTTGLPTAELRKRLLAIKGVGGYAAANLLMILERCDFIPVDSWAFKLVSHEWHGGQPVGQAEVESAFERWGEWKGLAYWFWDWSYTGG